MNASGARSAAEELKSHLYWLGSDRRVRNHGVLSNVVKGEKIYRGDLVWVSYDWKAYRAKKRGEGVYVWYGKDRVVPTWQPES